MDINQAKQAIKEFQRSIYRAQEALDALLLGHRTVFHEDLEGLNAMVGTGATLPMIDHNWELLVREEEQYVMLLMLDFFDQRSTSFHLPPARDKRRWLEALNRCNLAVFRLLTAEATSEDQQVIQQSVKSMLYVFTRQVRFLLVPPDDLATRIQQRLAPHLRPSAA